jgi:hypothetical protein
MLGTRRKLFKLINYFTDIEISEAHALLSENRFFCDSIRFLLALCEGKIHGKIAKIMIEEIDFESLAAKAVEIYQVFILPHMSQFLQERVN